MLFYVLVVYLGLLSGQLIAGNPTVVFSAHRIHDAVLTKDQIIVFDGVETNVGHNYNNNNGQFTCPVDGVYFFTVNILSHVNHLLQAHVVMDGVPIAGVYTVGAGPGLDDQSAASVVVRCSAGQRVWVRSLDDYLLNGEAVAMTQFAGFFVGEEGIDGTVAFSAFTTHDQHLAVGETLVFDAVTTNSGLNYDNTTGQFVCPVNGVYFLTVNVLSSAHRVFNVAVMLDARPVAGLMAVGASSSSNDHSAASVVVHCTEGERVSVQATRQSTVNGEPVGFTQLTGFLLARDGDRVISDAVPFPTVAFSAHRQHDYTIQAGAAVVFDAAETNVGHSYSTTSGKFTCPLDGTYFFTVNILSYLNRPFYAYIVLEDRPIAGVYAIGANSSADDQSLASVAVHCQTGQTVWVKSLAQQPINGEMVAMTTFTGFLLALDSPVSIIG